MKILVNRCYGGFGVQDYAIKEIGLDADEYYSDDELRVNPDLIALVEIKGSDYCGKHYSELVVVTIPENATDWVVDKYDGYENLYVVIDGKIKIV